MENEDRVGEVFLFVISLCIKVVLFVSCVK